MDILLPRALLFLSIAPFVASPAVAASVYGVHATTCSDSLSFDSEPLNVSCIGDLTLSGGVLSDDSSIFISTSGALILENLTINAPLVQLVAESVLFGSDSSIVATSISAAANPGGTTPTISTAPGATITLAGFTAPTPIRSDSFVLSPSGALVLSSPSVTLVPVPGALANLLAGMMALFGLRFGARRAA
jgi:hypothetical protein